MMLSCSHELQCWQRVGRATWAGSQNAIYSNYRCLFGSDAWSFHGPFQFFFRSFHEPNVNFTQAIKIKSRYSNSMQGVFKVENSVEGFDLDQWAAGTAFQCFWSVHKRASQANGDRRTPRAEGKKLGTTQCWSAHGLISRPGLRNGREPTASHNHV